MNVDGGGWIMGGRVLRRGGRVLGDVGFGWEVVMWDLVGVVIGNPLRSVVVGFMAFEGRSSMFGR